MGLARKRRELISSCFFRVLRRFGACPTFHDVYVNRNPAEKWDRHRAASPLCSFCWFHYVRTRSQAGAWEPENTEARVAQRTSADAYTRWQRVLLFDAIAITVR